MRTRAQTARDAALRRMTRVNRSLAAAALVGAGVLTDVVAHTASGHTYKTYARTGASSRLGGVELLTSSRVVTRSHRGKSSGPRHSSSAASSATPSAATPSSAPPSSATPSSATSSSVTPSQTSSSSSSVPAAAPAQPTVVAVSGGS